ncbi:hypothetical protein SUGI_0144890 [Cryptomeria japonica]|uniref:uncharacterized protein LOC131027217 n=1 Tax=Cryptomeria japonica TaxID=3369 RepID=UPI002408AADF|nr:uncharacterized protein LOC131027217 [Cryptomeria japonica]GLJ11159.1 hypothetical protein SUGI_0144890 [Cryptomeria japonica]
MESPPLQQSMEGFPYLTGAPTSLLPISSDFMASLRACKLQILTRNSKMLFLPNAQRSVKTCCTLNHTKTSLAKDDEFEELKKEKLGEAHSPVLLKEVLKVFEARPLGSFVDCTLGAAGHSSAIIKAHPELQMFIGLDVDPAAHEQAKPKLQAILDEDQSSVSSNLKLNIVCNNFKEIKSVVGQVDKTLLVDGVDGIVMDLGMSSMQLDNAERGFSVLYDGPLDMRMDPTALLRAEEIVNTWPEAELGRILRDYGEESRWRIIQRKIAEARLAGGIHSTSELVELVRNIAFKFSGRQGWMKTAIRVFQALRIAVNDELTTLENALSEAFTCLSSKGRLAVISFHSLEDRIVKQSFLNIINKDPSKKNDTEYDANFVHISGKTRYNKYRRKRITLEASNDDSCEEWMQHIVEGKYGKILTKRPIIPSKEEENVNTRCRSAKLRVLEKN